MVRTVTQIQGELGLPADATEDPFAQIETSVLENVQRTLAEQRSVQEEINAAKGVSRSTFTEQADRQQESSILSNVLSNLANVRAQDVLAERGFERQLVGQQTAADIAERGVEERTAAETQLIGTRTEAQRDLITSETEAQQQLITDTTQAFQERGEAQTAEQTELLQEQARLSEERAVSEFEREIGTLNAQTGLFEGGALAARVAAGEISNQAAFDRTKELTDINFQNQQSNLFQQQKFNADTLFGAGSYIIDPVSGLGRLEPTLLETDEDGNFVNPQGQIALEFQLNQQLQLDRLQIEKQIAEEQQATQFQLALLSQGIDVVAGVTAQGVSDFFSGLPGQGGFADQINAFQGPTTEDTQAGGFDIGNLFG